MLVPAQLHREELKQLTTERWFEERYKWYFAGEYYELQIGDNCQYRRSFACLDSNGKIVFLGGESYGSDTNRKIYSKASKGTRTYTGAAWRKDRSNK